MSAALKAKPLHEYSMRHLRRYCCGFCEQRLDVVKKSGMCGGLFAETRDECPMSDRLNGKKEPTT